MGKKTDIEYTFNGHFYRLYPNTPAGERAYCELPIECADGVIPAHWWASFKYAMKEAGLTLRKMRKSKMTTDEILDELKP